MNVITSKNMPKSNGHYSQCVEHNGFLFLSGQLPIKPDSREIPDGIENQALQVLQNIELILNEAGTCKENILQIRIYIPKIELWEVVNAVYTNFFGNHKPARCIVPTRELHFGCLIEAEAVAFIE